MNLKNKLFTVQTALLRGFNKDQTGHYQYTSLTNINQALKPLLKEVKVKLSFTFDEIEVIAINNQQAFKLLLTATFEDMDSEEIKTIKTYYIKSIKPNLDLIQNLGGAQTYARRYFLIAYFNLISDDDARLDPDAVGIESAIDKKGRAVATELETFISNLSKLPTKTQHAFKNLLSKNKLYKIKKLSLKLYDLKYLKETLAKAKLTNTPVQAGAGVTTRIPKKKRVATTAEIKQQQESTPIKTNSAVIENEEVRIETPLNDSDNDDFLNSF